MINTKSKIRLRQSIDVNLTYQTKNRPIESVESEAWLPSKQNEGKRASVISSDLKKKVIILTQKAKTRADLVYLCLCLAEKADD